MGDFNPLYTQIYYVFLYLFNTWEYMGYYGIYWVNTSALLRKCPVLLLRLSLVSLLYSMQSVHHIHLLRVKYYVYVLLLSYCKFVDKLYALTKTIYLFVCHLEFRD